MKVITDEKRIDEVLDRGVIKTVLPTKEEFKKFLMSGRKMKIYIGFDATANTLHLSHAKNIMLLEEFRKLGHEVVLLFGDFTARIGDPSGQIGTRKMLSTKDVLENVKSWKIQIKNLMDFNNKENPPKVLFNSKWLAKMTLEEMLQLASHITVGQMVERDMFQKRIKEGKFIFLHEFLYPLMQGYDSVAMEVDVELCGTDQIFNALMGRTLLKKIKGKEKFVVAVNLMENPQTGELMSKTRGTGVFLNTSPSEMFGSIMAQPDEMTEVFLLNCTKIGKEEIKEIIKQGPFEAKKKTALEIVKLIFNDKKAKEAEDNFVKTFQKKEVPDDVEELLGSGTLASIMLKKKMFDSNSKIRRLFEEGAVKDMTEDKKLAIHDEAKSGHVYKVGKHKFFKIK